MILLVISLCHFSNKFLYIFPQPPQEEYTGNNKVQNDDSKQNKEPESKQLSTRNTSVITQQPTSVISHFYYYHASSSPYFLKSSASEKIVAEPELVNFPARMKDPSLSFDSFRKLLKTFLFDKWLLHECICGSCVNLRGEMFIIIIIITILYENGLITYTFCSRLKNLKLTVKVLIITKIEWNNHRSYEKSIETTTSNRGYRAMADEPQSQLLFCIVVGSLCPLCLGCGQRYYTFLLLHSVETCGYPNYKKQLTVTWYCCFFIVYFKM